MELYTRTDTDPNLEVTTREFTYKGITIPEGFTSDGASTPRFLWSIIPPYKATKKAAFIHDYLCKTAGGQSDRERADKIFMEILKDVSKLNPVRYTLGYYGVRLGAMVGVGVRYSHWTDKVKKTMRRIF